MKNSEHSRSGRKSSCGHDHPGCLEGVGRRDFLKIAGGVAAAASFLATNRAGAAEEAEGGGAAARPARTTALVRGAFIYPPTADLNKVGYYSWPGSSFDAEGRQKQYMRRLKEMERDVGIAIDMNETPLDEKESVDKFIEDVKKTKPDGLLLFPFKKGHWGHVVRIVKETETPAVVLATQGVLLVGHVRQLYAEPGTYMINSLNNLDAVEQGMKMIRASHRLRQATIININGSKRSESRVPGIGTRVVTVPHQRFYDIYAETEVDDKVHNLAGEWQRSARKIVQPSEDDIVDAARAYYALKRLVDEEQADALMMNCLAGLRRPHKHVPPCMGFMKLRDEGIPAGCESDLHATLTMLMWQELFDKPAFQHNESLDTEKNTYFGAHCTSASKMKGLDAEAEPMELMSHAEAGWGCVPRVLMEPGASVTIGYYLPPGSDKEKGRMAIYTGEVIQSPPIPETGGCRSNVEVKLSDMEDVIDFKAGRHTCMIYGDHGDDLRNFCQLMGIEEIT